MIRPFSIRLFSPSGETDGVLVASRDNWTGRAVIFPRALTGEVKGRREYQEPGIYILVNSKQMYIGEGDPVGDRINRHFNEKPFWNKGVFFTAEGGCLNKAHVQHLEARLIALAKDANRVLLDNANRPSVPALSEEDRAFAENFLYEVLLMLPLLGFWQFSKVDDVDDDQEEQDSISNSEISAAVTLGKRAALYSSIPEGLQFKLSARNANATLEVAEGAVIVKERSRVADTVTERFDLNGPGYAAQRRQLLESGVIEQTPEGMVFTKDQFFTSGSAAASVVLGSVSNADWWLSTQDDKKSLGDYIREARRKALYQDAGVVQE